MKTEKQLNGNAVLRRSMLAGTIGAALASGSVLALDFSGTNYQLRLDTTVSY